MFLRKVCWNLQHSQVLVNLSDSIFHSSIKIYSSKLGSHYSFITNFDAFLICTLLMNEIDCIYWYFTTSFSQHPLICSKFVFLIKLREKCLFRLDFDLNLEESISISTFFNRSSPTHAYFYILRLLNAILLAFPA